MEDLDELPDALEETVAVAEALGTTPRIGAEATEERVFADGRNVDVVHIAAHAIYDPVHPSFSRIALTPGSDRDGNLEVHEILAGLDLEGVNLVVLSACQTARGTISAGDEVTSLARAFLHAGSPGVIATLWNVKDDAAAAVMKELYCRLVAGDSAADALRAAQLSMLRSHSFREPRFWAPFELVGNPAGRW